MIEFSRDNMFADKYDILINTVNCVGAMGKGVALVFRDRYPDMYASYQAKCRQGVIRPGKLMEWKPKPDNDPTTPGTIINFPTKRHYRDNSRYDDIEIGLNTLREYLLPLGPVTVGIPPLGCGNGGLDWTLVSQMIFEKLSDLDANITVFEPREIPDEISSTEVVLIDKPVKAIKVKSEAEPKKKKEKKRPSDFEIIRTIFQRTHERKLPFLLKNIGEDPDIFFLCSKDESEFTYGSPDITIAIFEILDDDLKIMADNFVNKLYGLQNHSDNQLIINIRDQISELAKTKGENIEVEVETDSFGSSWTIKKDINGKERTQYFSKAIESLFHVQLVKDWCRSYRPLLTTNDPINLYYPYKHPDGETASIMTLPAPDDGAHPLKILYPYGFRTMVTRGIDVILNKLLEEFPYPIINEEMIVFQDQAAACQIAHRITAEGWRMVLLRPNAVFFPTLDIPLSLTGNHSL